MRNYLVIYERTRGGYGAYSPDLPGCVAVGRTKAIVQRRMRAAILMHVEGLRQDGVRLPPAQTTADYVDVDG